MASGIAKRYPPYEGAEPYAYLCFSDEDAARVEPWLSYLRRRGVRVWYAAGPARTAAETEARQLRAQRASLTLLFLTASAQGNTLIKGTALYCLSKGQPLACIEAEDGVSALSMGIPEDTPRIKAHANEGMDELGDALIHTEGFTQELIGEPQAETAASGKRLPALFAALAVILLAAGIALGLAHARPSGQLREGDTLPLTDATLIAAARAAVDGGALTEESAEAVRVLHLAALPEDASELAWFTGLERIEIPQEEAESALPLIDEGYEIVLYGGDAS